MTHRILVVDDSAEILQLYRDVLEGEGGYEISALSSLEADLLSKIRDCRPHLIISDYIFGEEKSGWEVVQQLRLNSDTRQIPVIICSAAVRELRDKQELLTKENIGLLYKPFDIDELLSMVEAKLEGSGIEMLEEEART